MRFQIPPGSGTVAPSSGHQVGAPVWLEMCGQWLPAVVIRPGATKVKVAFHRPRLLGRAIQRRVVARIDLVERLFEYPIDGMHGWRHEVSR